MSHIRVEKQTELSESDLAEALKTPDLSADPGSPEQHRQAQRGQPGHLSILAKADNRIVLTIRDNGQGFDPGEVVKGLGLSTMKERTELSGGEYCLESAPGKGNGPVCLLAP